MPYLRQGTRSGKKSQAGASPVIGFVGVGSYNKGIDVFARMAERFDGMGCRFMLAGFVPDPAMERRLRTAGVESVSGAPIGAASYRHGIEEMDYVCFLYRPRPYRFVASAAIFDALNARKPVIVLANDFFDPLFEEHGRIGYRCATEVELAERVEMIARGECRAEYGGIVESIDRMWASREAEKLRSFGRLLEDL